MIRRKRAVPHPLVQQLRFARSEFVRGFEGVTEEEGFKRFLPINSLGWMVAHLASQEQRYWLWRAQGRRLLPELDEIAGYGRPASTPSISEMWDAWRAIIAEVDPWLDEQTTESLQTHLLVDGQPHDESIGTMVRRVTYHYFFHTGEVQAVRQLLGHTDLPEFVGDIEPTAGYVPETVVAES
jgi:hypothetical protein